MTLRKVLTDRWLQRLWFQRHGGVPMPALAWLQLMKQGNNPALNRQARWGKMTDTNLSGIWLLTNPQKKQLEDVPGRMRINERTSPQPPAEHA